MPDDDSPDAAPAVVTIVDRLVAAGISPERAHAWIDAGDVEVDGEHVSDPSTPAPWGVSRYMINPQ